MDYVFAHQILVALQNLPHDGYCPIFSNRLLYFNELTQIAVGTILGDEKIIGLRLIDIDALNNIGVVEGAYYFYFGF